MEGESLQFTSEQSKLIAMRNLKDSSLSFADSLIEEAKRFREKLDHLRFSPPVAHVYNPLFYSWRPHETYLRRFGNSKKRVVFLGMNPGPFGMVQTGIPFGEVKAVREWMRIEEVVEKPAKEHPKRPIEGFSCKRSEVSGQRLWGLFAARFPKPEDFFKEHFVLNYCPLAFLEQSGANRTPDKLPSSETQPLYEFCDEYLVHAVNTLQPDWLVGVGGFAQERLQGLFESGKAQIGRILHPSPASPAANRNWAGLAAQQLRELGVWS